MIVILQSQEKFNEIALLDFATGNFEITQKTEKEVKITGYYSHPDGTFIWFFRLDEDLYFGVDKQIIKFQEGDSVSIESLSNNRYRFSVHRDHEDIFEHEYQGYQSSPPILAFQIVNPMSSEEDFDIFLFINNVMNNEERRQRVFRKLS
jgi:hypothetical protein